MCVQCYGSMGVLLFGQDTLDSNVHVMLRLTMCVCDLSSWSGRLSDVIAAIQDVHMMLHLVR
jgi:hypothetical protein